MVVREIFETGLIKDSTEVFIRDSYLYLLAHGNWNQDDILKFKEYAVESFTWQHDGEFYIDVF